MISTRAQRLVERFARLHRENATRVFQPSTVRGITLAEANAAAAACRNRARRAKQALLQYIGDLEAALQDFDAVPSRKSRRATTKPQGYIVASLLLPQARYYKDTRGLPGYDGDSNYFTSSELPDCATIYKTRRAAQRWAREFIGVRMYRVLPAPQVCLDAALYQARHALDTRRRP